jgi:hypothetical protein
LCLAKAHPVQALDDCANPFEGPQFGAESMLGGVLQDGCTQGCQLPLIELGWATALGHPA